MKKTEEYEITSCCDRKYGLTESSRILAISGVIGIKYCAQPVVPFSFTLQIGHSTTCFPGVDGIQTLPPP